MVPLVVDAGVDGEAVVVGPGGGAFCVVPAGAAVVPDAAAVVVAPPQPIVTPLFQINRQGRSARPAWRHRASRRGAAVRAAARAAEPSSKSIKCYKMH